MSVTVTYVSQATVDEDPPQGVDDCLDPTIRHDAFNTSETLNSGSTPPCTVSNGFILALVAGAGTIDLTAVLGTGGAEFDRTGLKLQVAKFQAPSGNSAAITLTSNVANGYDCFGADWVVVLGPGEEFLWRGYDNSTVPDVGAAAKIIDLTGAGTDVLNCELVFG